MTDSFELTEDSCREALAAVLASETLHHSDQLCKILQYICQAAIEGRSGQITENAIAIDVLNRLPSYTPTEDSSVRSRVYTLRKKLAHYYEVENPSSPVCIEIPKGGYVPHFFPRNQPSGLRMAFRERSRWLLLSAIAAVTLPLVVVLAFQLYQSNAIGIWAPLIESGKRPILVVVGAGKFVPSTGGGHDENTSNLSVPVNFNNYKVDRLGTGDARSLFRLGVLFGQLHVTSELRLSSETSFEDLHRSPTVLLSAFNNQFTLQATSNLRYRFVPYDKFNGQIEDSKQPSVHWHLNVSPDGEMTNDYGIAARLVSQPTQEPVMIAAGLEQCGTEAGLAVLTDAQKQLIHRLPVGWRHKNFEALVGVNVVDGSCGVPTILRLEVW